MLHFGWSVGHRKAGCDFSADVFQDYSLPDSLNTRVLYAPMLRALAASSVNTILTLFLLLVGGSALAASPVVLNVIGDTGDCDLPGTAQVSATMRRQSDFKDARLIEVGDLAYPVATRDRLLECHEPYFSMFP